MKKKISLIVPVFLLGIVTGWIFFHPAGKLKEKQIQSPGIVKADIWTCSMHPQIRMTHPGKCPLCDMDLIPLSQTGAAAWDPDAIHLSKDAAALANVMTSVAGRQKPSMEVRLYGKVQADERKLQSQVAHVSGRIEKLNINFTGESVSSGQVLASIYSPELITAQQELLEAAKTKLTQPAIYAAAKEKLLQWKLTDDQIVMIETTGKVQSRLDIVSTTTGVVIARNIREGDYVAQGSVIFEIADLSELWVTFDAYETDLQYLHRGDKVKFNIQALTGMEFSGIIGFIDPVIDPVTRVARVRVEIMNRSGLLKPGMFVTGIVTTTLSQYYNNIVVPKSSVLWTGKNSIVYVKNGDDEGPIFKMREIQLGPMLGESYIVISGLSEGEEIVTNGTFSVDAAAQLQGKPSMMNKK